MSGIIKKTVQSKILNKFFEFFFQEVMEVYIFVHIRLLSIVFAHMLRSFVQIFLNIVEKKVFYLNIFSVENRDRYHKETLRGRI